MGVHRRTLQFWLEGIVHSCNVHLSKLIKEMGRLRKGDEILGILWRDLEQHRAAIEVLSKSKA